jgi:hypothetical protein
MRYLKRAIAGYLFVVASSANATPPALKSGEEIVKTRDGCGMVIDGTSVGAPAMRAMFSKLTWGSACVDGLVMGESIIGAGVKLPGALEVLPSIGWVWYGRVFGPQVMPVENGTQHTSFSWDVTAVRYTSLDTAKPVWSELMFAGSSVSDGRTTVSTALSGATPSIVVIPPGGATPYVVDCPKKSTSTKGCEKVWQQYAGPVIENIQAFLAGTESKVEERMADVRSLVARWQAEVGPAVVERRAADARQAAMLEGAKASEKAALDDQCFEKSRNAPAIDAAQSFESIERRVLYLEDIFNGTCAASAFAPSGLEEAAKLVHQAVYASDCLEREARDGTVGLRNKCPYEVTVHWCNEKPDPNSFSGVLDCAKDSFGGVKLQGSGWTGNNMQAERFHWLACRYPAMPQLMHFDAKQGHVFGTCAFTPKS